MMYNRNCMTLVLIFITVSLSSACPSECTSCTINVGLRARILCKGVASFPKGIPESTKILQIQDGEINYIGPAYFRQLIYLEYLYIINVSLHTIHTDAFQYLTKLKYLSLRQNNLSRIPVLTNMSELAKIDLGYNNIRSLNRHDFLGAPNLKVLFLGYNRIQFLHQSCLPDLPELTMLSLKFNLISEIYLNSSLNDSSMVFLKTLQLDGNCIKTIRICCSTHLKHLYLSKNGGVLNIERSSLVDLPSLTYLELNGNQMQLCDHPFKGTPFLQHLYLKRSRILSVNKSIFSGLFRLQTLFLDECNMSSLTLPKLMSLIHLSLNRNRFADIGSIQMQGLQNLQKLYLIGNRLTSINANSFTIFPKLKHLFLDKNKISFIHQNGFKGLKSLDILHLDENQLTVLPKTVFRDSPMLRSLWLNGNQIRIIDGYHFNGLTRLNHIYLNRNEITTFRGRVFYSLTDLRSLHLNKNRLKELRKQWFVGISRLAFLDAGNNMIKQIEQSTFEEVATLRSLDLSNNSLQFINPHTFSPLGQLNRLNLGSNDLETLTGSTFAGLKKLRRLDLHNNKLEWISNQSFSGMSILHELHINGNRIPCSCSFAKFVRSINAMVEADCLTPSGATLQLVNVKCSNSPQKVEKPNTNNFLRNLVLNEKDKIKDHELGNHGLDNDEREQIVDDVMENSNTTTSTLSEESTAVFPIILSQVMVTTCFGLVLRLYRASRSKSICQPNNDNSQNSRFNEIMNRRNSYPSVRQDKVKRRRSMSI